MSSPTPDQSGQSSGGSDSNTSNAKPVKGIKVLDVVEYTHHDPILGREHTAVGVVVRVGNDNESVAIRPLAAHHVEVDPANLLPIKPDDVG
jgi:hypothetical protein